MMGAKGILSTHLHFELGVAAAVTTWRFTTMLDTNLFDQADRLGVLNFFKSQARAIDDLSLYERFSRTGWTVGLARLVRKVLAPAIAETIAIIWMLAYREAGYKLRGL